MKLKEIREMYPEGTQIVLTEMAGESQMPYGLKGTVKFVDDAGQIHMSWENGSSLALNIHEDTFEKVEAPEKISVILVEPGRYPKLIRLRIRWKQCSLLWREILKNICPLRTRLPSSATRKER